MTQKRKITLYVLLLGLILGLFMGLSVNVKRSSVSATESTAQMEAGVAFRSRWYIRQCGLIFTGSISKSEWEGLEADGYTANLFITTYDYITGLSRATAASFETAKDYLAEDKYVEAFASHSKLKSITVNNVTPTLLENKYYFRAGIKDMLDENLNREYFGVIYYEKDNGDGTFDRIYSSVADRSTIAKSMCYVSTAVYNTTYSTADEETLANLEHFMTVAAKSATPSVDQVDSEALAEKSYAELVEIEIVDMTYGDDSFSYKIFIL